MDLTIKKEVKAVVLLLVPFCGPFLAIAFGAGALASIFLGGPGGVILGAGLMALGF